MLLYIVHKNGARIQIKCICDTMLKQKSKITEIIICLGYLINVWHSEIKRIVYLIENSKTLDSV